MPDYEPKPGAPAVFTLKEAAVSAVTGTEAGWLANFFPLLPQAYINTADFCRAGPPAAPGLDLSDFVSIAQSRKSREQMALTAVFLTPKLWAVASNRVFGLYCRERGPVQETASLCGVDAEFDVDGSGGQIEYWMRQQIVCSFYRIITTRLAGPWTSNNEVHAGWGGVCFHPPLAMLPDNVGETVSVDVRANRLDGGWPTELARADTWCTSTYGGSRAHVRIEAWLDAGASLPGPDYVPVPQPEPANLNVPGPNIYDSFGALGQELDRQELKLDNVLAMLQWLTSQTARPAAAVDSAASVSGLGPRTVPIPDDAVGAIVGLTVPTRIAAYGQNPGTLVGAGHISIGWNGAWMYSTLLKHTNQIIYPIPSAATVLGLDVQPDIGVAVTWIRESG